MFDRRRCLERVLWDEDLARSIAATFLADMPFHMQRLQAAIAVCNLSAAEQHAHTVKGAAQIISGRAVEQIASTMELAARAGDVQTLEALMPQLLEAFEALCGCLEKNI